MYLLLANNLGKMYYLVVRKAVDYGIIEEKN